MGVATSNRLVASAVQRLESLYGWWRLPYRDWNLCTVGGVCRTEIGISVRLVASAVQRLESLYGWWRLLYRDWNLCTVRGVCRTEIPISNRFTPYLDSSSQE